MNEMIKGIKEAGFPIKTYKPLLEIINKAEIEEVSINIASNLGLKIDITLPGIDQVIEEFIKDK